MANIIQAKITTTPTFAIPDAELIRVFTNSFMDLLWEINLNGLNVRNNLRILTKLRSIPEM